MYSQPSRTRFVGVSSTQDGCSISQAVNTGTAVVENCNAYVLGFAGMQAVMYVVDTPESREKSKCIRVETPSLDMTSFHRTPPFRVTMTAKFGEYGVTAIDVKPVADAHGELLAKYRATTFAEAVTKVAHGAECCFVDAVAQLRIKYDEPTKFGMAVGLTHPDAPHRVFTMYVKRGEGNGLRLSRFWVDANPQYPVKGMTVHCFKASGNDRAVADPEWIELGGEPRHTRRFRLLQVVNVERLSGERATVVAVPVFGAEPEEVRLAGSKEFVPTKGSLIVSMIERQPMSVAKALEHTHVVDSLKQSLNDALVEYGLAVQELRMKTADDRAEAKRRIETSREVVGKCLQSAPERTASALDVLFGGEDQALFRELVAKFNAEERGFARFKVLSERDPSRGCHVFVSHNDEGTFATYEAAADAPLEAGTSRLPSDLTAGVKLCMAAEAALERELSRVEDHAAHVAGAAAAKKGRRERGGRAE